MDRQYLKHIDSSPYVDEGFFDTAKATAAGLGQRAKNYLPSEDPYETPLNAKLQSYYKTLVNELKGILEEFSLGPKSPAERLKRSQLSQEQRELVYSLTNLYQVLVPSVFPAGTRPEIRGATVQRTVRPPNVSYAQSMQHLAKEAWLGRASARSGGEVDSIINKYLNDVKAAYSRFINNVKKHFPGVLASKVSDSFKTTLGNPKISKTLDKIESIAKTDVPVETPASGTPAPPPPATPSSTPTKTPLTGKPSTEQEKKNANDLATLIAATLNIISARVIEDKNSRPYYSKPLADGNFYLPKTVDEPYPLQHSSEWNPPHPPHEPENLASLPDTDPEKIKYLSDKAEYEKKLASYRYVPIKNDKGEIISYTYKLVTPQTTQAVPSPKPYAPQTPEPSFQMEEVDGTDEDVPADSDEEADTADDELEMTGEFLYDFASLYRKYHGNYSIEVTKSPVKVVFSDGRETVIRVFWNWNKHLNTILIQTLKDGKSWETSELLKFYDDEVNPQSPYYSSSFNIPHFLEQVNPNAKALYAKADNSKIDEIDSAEKVFKPAAYAVIRRKGPMEFKSFKSLRFHVPPEWENQKKGDPHWGDVKLLRGKFGKFPRQSTIPFKAIHDYYYTKKNETTQAKFESALDEADYWNSYVGIKDEFKEPAPITGDDEEDEDRSIDASRIPAASDAIKTLVVLGHTEKKATDWIQQVVDKVGPDKTAAEYVKLAQKNPTLSPTSPKTSTSSAAPTGPAPATSLKSRSDDIKKIPAAVNAVAELKTMKISLNKAWELVGKAIETLGPDKTKDEYVQFASKEYKALPPVETAPEVPKAAVGPEPAAPEVPKQPIPKAEEPPAVEAPKLDTPPEASSKKPIMSPEQVLDLFNTKLKNLGLETLDNVEQLIRLNSMKGGFNTALSNKANALDNEDDKNKILAKQLKGAPTEETKNTWASLISKAKSPPSSKSKKKPDVSEGMINPFQWSNFI